MMEVKIKIVKDPVCGMNVDEKTAALKSEYLGKTYYFCNQPCKVVLDKKRARVELKSKSSMKVRGGVL